MIVTRTPFRLTLGGGGTDLPSFYEKHGGYVMALGIDKYMYVALNAPTADQLIRLHYTQSETVERTADLKHDLAREALRAHGIDDTLEIASLADIPAGTGLGSSSCYLVGLLNALHTYLLHPARAEELAQQACDIELGVLRKPIGKQDQYMAAYGGLTELSIARNGTVEVNQLFLPDHVLLDFVSKTHLYYTNVRRDAMEILEDQNAAMHRTGRGAVEENLLRIKDIGRRIGNAMRAADFDEFGRLMHEHWLLKKTLSSKITVPVAERIYDHVRSEFGVLGGKIAGAGGGGFMMLYCPKDGQRLSEFMAEQGMARFNYLHAFEGSRVITNVRSTNVPHHHATPGLTNPGHPYAARR